MPALPLDDAGPYVAAAYLVFVALILIYVAVMAGKLVRISRELTELEELVERHAAANAAGESTAGAGEPESPGRSQPRSSALGGPEAAGGTVPQ